MFYLYTTFANMTGYIFGIFAVRHFILGLLLYRPASLFFMCTFIVIASAFIITRHFSI